MAPLDSFAASPCHDPGVTRNPKIDAARHREALAVCERKRHLAAQTYEGTRRTFGLGME